MRSLIIAVILVGILGTSQLARADMSSTNYQIRWDTVSTGGSDTGASASYGLRDTLGNAAIGNGESATYQLRAGYRQGEFDQVITFDVLAQEAGSERSATASAGTTITCSTSGLSVGDFVALIQDEGDSQVSAVGQIVSIGVGTITVDELKDGGTAPVIDGTNDLVSLLSGSTLNMGELDPAIVATQLVAFNVNADVDSGYVVQTFDDGNLESGANDIDDVADGTVSAGTEEYGGRSSDTTLATSTFDTDDTAFTTTAQDVADRSDNSFESRDFVTLKASIDVATVDAFYTQNLSFIVSGNY